MSLRFTSVPMQNGQFIWRLHTSENELLARSGQGFETLVSAQRAAAAFKARCPRARFEVYVNAVGEWRWRVYRTRIAVARSGSAFATRADAEHAVEEVQVNAVSASGP